MSFRTYGIVLGLPIAIGCTLYGCGQQDSTEYQSVGLQRSAPSSDSDSDSDNEPSAAKTAEVDSERPAPSEVVVQTAIEAESRPAGEPRPNEEPTERIDDAKEISNPATTTAAPAVEKPAYEVLVKEKSFLRDRKSGAMMLSYEDLDMEKVLNMKSVTENVKDLMPGWLSGLNGKKVRLRGFMKPTFVTEGIERFVLARDTGVCCFGPDPKIDYLVDVRMKRDTSTDFIPNDHSFDVIGTFKIEPEAESGKLFGLWVIDDAAVVTR